MVDGLVQQDPLTAAAKQSAEPRELGLVLVSFTFILVCYLYIFLYFCKMSILFKCMHFMHRYRTSPTSTAPPAYSPTECQRRQPSRGTSL